MTPEELYNELKDLQDEESIKAVAEPFDKWIREKYSTLESVRTQMTKYNKLIKSILLVEGENAYYYQKHNGELVIRHFFYKYAGLKPEEYNQLNDKSNEQKEARLDNGTLLEPLSFLESVGKLLTSDDYKELVVGIIAATGRRPSEVLLRGDFTPAKATDLIFPDNQPITHWLMFSGQVKKRRNTAAERYPIATLFPSDFIIKSVKRLRRMPEVIEQIKAIEVDLKPLIADINANYTKPEERDYQIALAKNEAVDDKFETVTNRVVKVALPKVLEVRHGKTAITRSSLRAAYACLAVARDCPSGKNDLLWASRLLGHKEEGGDLRALLTTAGYFDYYIEKDATVPLLDEPKAEATAVWRGYVSDVNEVRAFQERFDTGNHPETFHKIWELAKEAMEARERKLFVKVEEVEKVEEIKVQKEEVSTVINKEELLSEVSQMIDGKLASILEKIESIANPAPTPTPISTATELAAVPTPTPTVIVPVPTSTSTATATAPAPVIEKPWVKTPTEDLKGKKIPGSAEEKIKRAVQAIFNYNDYSASSNNERWFLGVRSIQDLSGCNYAPIKKFIDDYSTMIADHNGKYGLSNQHNKKHTKAISEIILNW